MLRKDWLDWLKPGRLPMRRRRYNPWIEGLEERIMLNSTPAVAPPAVVLGRTLSSYTVSSIQNNQLIITFTVYNEQATAISGILLTDTLQTGVTFQDASIQPDQNGQQLAWSLGPLNGFDRISVTMALLLPSPSPQQIDAGADVFATLDGAAVTASTPAAQLRQGTIDPTLLAATSGANITDPFVQEKAAELQYDPNQIYAFLQSQIGYNSYTGSVRGARGTLWSSSGNALDVASLGVALMRASGIPAQYASGTLSTTQAQQLIGSMFPSTFQVLGLIPTGTQTADPLDDSQLLTEAESHYWFQFDTGSGMQDADPLMPGAKIGQTFTTAAGTFTEVPVDLREQTEVQLTAETYSQLSGLLGGNGLTQTVVLDETFDDVDLVGRDISVANTVSTNSVNALIFASTTHTYTPYLQLSDASFPVPGADQIITGTAYQETLTNFPLGNQIVTGLFLNLTLKGPDGPAETDTRTLVDRIGYAARQGLVPPNVTADPSQPPLISPTDVYTISILPGMQSPQPLGPLTAKTAAYDAFLNQVASTQPMPDADTLNRAAHNFAVLYNQVQLGNFLATSSREAANFSAGSVVAYYDRPRITLFSQQYDPKQQTFNFAIDQVRHTMRVLPVPGQNPLATPVFNVTIGTFDNTLEQDAVPVLPGSVDVGTVNVFQQAATQGIPVVVLTQQNASLLATLNLSPEAKARISTALDSGFVVVVPSQEVTVGNTSTVSWYEINPKTGETSGVLEHGTRSFAISLAAQQVVLAIAVAGIISSLIVIAIELGLLLAKLVNELNLSAPINPAMDPDKPPLVTPGGNPVFPNPNPPLVQPNGQPLPPSQPANPPVVQPVTPPVTVDPPTIKNPPVKVEPPNDQDEKKKQLRQLDSALAGLGLGGAVGAAAFPPAAPAIGIATAATVFLTFVLVRQQLQKRIDEGDPPVFPLLSGSQFPFPDSPGNIVSSSLSLTPTVGSGPLTGQRTAASAQVSGQLSASWQSSAASAFAVTSLNAGSAVVQDSTGATVGSGTVSLAAATPLVASVSGSNTYSINGTGQLSFYGPAEPTLGVSGDWNSYSGTATGNVSITLQTDALLLNGAPLPAGTYTITTSSATLAGAGGSSAPNFAGSAAITATGATVYLGSGSGSLSVAGTALDPTQPVTLTGYTGTINVAGGGANQTDALTLNGMADNVLALAASTATFTADQNTPATFKVNFQTSLPDTYTVNVQAPPGWTVTLDAQGNVTALPAPGLQSGTYPIQLIAQSTTNLDIIAQTTVNVTVQPTQPGITLSVQPDTLLTVPFQGAQVPTAYDISIHNSGPAADTFNLSFSNVPGFTVQSSVRQVTIPAGQTAMVGVYLTPSGNQVPAVGTAASFDVTATSTSDPTITSKQTQAFTVPAIDAVTLTSNPVSLSTTPGSPVTATLTLTNVGNMPENVGLTGTPVTGLSASSLTPVSLDPGQSTTETITLTPVSSSALNSTQQATITASFGPSTAPVTQTLVLNVQVVAPGVAALGSAAVAANQAGNTALGNRLSDLSIALTSLFQNPTDPVARSQALANLDSLISQVTHDPLLASFAAGLSAGRAAIAAAASAADVQTALATLGTALTSFGQAIIDEAAHGFTLGLLFPNAQVQPQAPTAFTIVLKNTGNQTTTYDLGDTGLPANVTAAFSQPSVTLQPGQQIGGGSNAVTLSLTETGDTLFPATFTITATPEGAPEIATGTPGALTLRDTFLQVASVTSNPPFVPTGVSGSAAQVDITAQVQSALNAPQSDTVTYTVQDPSGKKIFTSAPVPVSLTITSTLTKVDLGTFDTTGLAQGLYTLTATLTDASGNPIAGSAGQGSLVIGIPITASVTTTPPTVPTGSATVTTNVQVHGQMSFPAPLTVLGQVATQDDELSTVLFGTNLAYVVGANGISIIDVSDPSNPKLLKTFAQDVVVKGGFNIAQVKGNDLLVASNVSLNSSGFNFIVYDLTDPMNPQLVSNTDIPFRFLTDMYVLGNIALFPIQEFDFFPGGQETYFGQSGNVLVVDISDLTKPKVVGQLFQNDNPERNHPEGTAVIVNSQVAYTVSSTETGGDTSSGVGNLRILNISNPAVPTLAGNLNIPNTETLTNVALGSSNRALVVGSSGGLLQPFNDKMAGLTGNVTLTVLDISDPQNPTVLGSTLVTEATSSLDATAPSSRRDLANLGNGLFALSNVLEGGKPALLLIDASDPNNIVVGALQTPALVNGLTVSGSTLYAGTPTGLTTYNIGQLVSAPVTVSVQVPADSANLSLVAKSFDKPPSQIVTGSTTNTYVFKRSLAFGNTDLSFSWQTLLNNLKAADNPAVTLGTTVDTTTAAGTQTITLPGTSVTAVPIISLSPATQTVQPGATAVYDVRLSNPTNAPITYDLEEQGAPGQPNFDSSSIMIGANSSTDVLLRLQTTTNASAGSSPFTVTATESGGKGAQGTASGTLILAGAPIPTPDDEAHGVVVTLTPSSATAGQGQPATYVLQVTNTGSTDDTFALSLAGLPDSVTAVFTPTTVDVPPGASNFRDVLLTLTPKAGSAPGAAGFTVTATSTSQPAVSGAAAGTLNVVDNGVTVSLNPPSGAPGSGFQLTVTNTGTAADTFDLSLGGPAGMVATLATNKVTLAAGASQVVPIDTSAVNFAIPGALPLSGVAVSESAPSVTGNALTALMVPTTQALTAQLTPPTQTLSAAGPAAFQIQVNNTGNATDSYTATIVGTTGPITASLVGLDGLPTQTIPVFTLPALSSGVLTLNSTLATLGQGTVTVQIKSLTSGAITATTTATVLATTAAPPGAPAAVPAAAVTPSTPAGTTLAISPTLVVPARVVLFRNGSRAVRGIHIAATDVGGGQFAVTLHADRGQLRLRSTAGLSRITGNGSTSLRLVGTLAALNQALGSLRYTDARGFAGTVRLQASLAVSDTPDLSISSGTVQLQVLDRMPAITLASLPSLQYHMHENRPLIVTTHRDLPRAFHDPDNDPVQFQLVRGPNPATGHVELHRDGSFTFTPAHGFRGTASMVVRTFDGLVFSQPLLVLFIVP